MWIWSYPKFFLPPNVHSLSLTVILPTLREALALFTSLWMLLTLTYFEHVTRVQADIPYKNGSFILLLPAAVNWLHQKAKTDRQSVLTLLLPIPSYHPESRNLEQDSKCTLLPLRVFGKELQRKHPSLDLLRPMLRKLTLQESSTIFCNVQKKATVS